VLLIWLLTTLTFFSTVANAQSNWKVQGQTRFSFWFWDVYDAGYWRKIDSQDKQNENRLISIRYLRSIKSSELINATRSQWLRMTINSEMRERWLTKLALIWPDVKPNDRIDFIQTDHAVCFFLNGKSLGVITDAEFSQPFFDIWLGENAEYPKHSVALRKNKKTAYLAEPSVWRCS